MPEASAQYVEPGELRMLRKAMAATLSEMQSIELSLEIALKSLRSAMQRTQLNQAWVQAVEIHVEQEARS